MELRKEERKALVMVRETQKEGKLSVRLYKPLGDLPVD